MKIKSVAFNNHRKAFEIEARGKAYSFPYAKTLIGSSPEDLVTRAFVDKELASEGFTYELRSGEEGSVLLDQVLDYNQDPDYLRRTLLYKLTLEARKRVDESALSKREIVRRLGTSASQLYRLLDQTNYRKSIDQLLTLLSVLECDVDFVIHARSA